MARKLLRSVGLAAGLSALVTLGQAAMPAHLFLKANGTEIAGEGTVATLAGDDVSSSIECLSFEHTLTAGMSATGRPARGSRTPSIVITKRIDKSTPLLMQALANNQVIDAEFRFYRNNPVDGTAERFYTIGISQAKIASVHQFVLDVLDPDTASMPPMEEVTFVFHKIVYELPVQGLSFQTELASSGAEPEAGTEAPAGTTESPRPRLRLPNR